MYSGGFINEFELVLAIKNGEIRLVPTMMYVFIAIILIIAIFAMLAQISDRRHHLEMYRYKGHFNT